MGRRCTGVAAPVTDLEEGLSANGFRFPGSRSRVLAEDCIAGGARLGLPSGDLLACLALSSPNRGPAPLRHWEVPG